MPSRLYIELLEHSLLHSRGAASHKMPKGLYNLVFVAIKIIVVFWKQVFQYRGASDFWFHEQAEAVSQGPVLWL